MTIGIDSQALDELLARAQLHEQLKNAPDLTLTADQAAFYLGVHPKKLERWRREKLPPYPASMNAEGRSGVQVLYTVGALNDFIRSSQQEPAPVDAPGNGEIAVGWLWVSTFINTCCSTVSRL